jgi:hypothetical protein
MNSPLNGAVFELVGSCHTRISVAGRNPGLVFGDIAALQDESADGKQEQEDKREVEFGAAELADHERFPLLLVWFCGFHDLGVGSNSRVPTQPIPRLESVPPEHLITVPDSRCVNEHTGSSSVR